MQSHLIIFYAYAREPPHRCLRPQLLLGLNCLSRENANLLREFIYGRSVGAQLLGWCQRLAQVAIGEERARIPLRLRRFVIALQHLVDLYSTGRAVFPDGNCPHQTLQLEKYGRENHDSICRRRKNAKNCPRSVSS